MQDLRCLRDSLLCAFVASLAAAGATYAAEETAIDHSPRPDEQQLPYTMHAGMSEVPRITVFRNNTIRDTRRSDEATQTVGILIEETVGELTLDGNRIDAKTPIDDRRQKE
jgi:hypothetical protein